MSNGLTGSIQGNRKSALAGVVLFSLTIMFAGCSANKPVVTNDSTPVVNNQPAQIASAGYQVDAVTNGGSIEGQITLNGKPIHPRPVLVSQDASVCGARRLVYPVKLDGDGIEDAVVWVDDIHHGKAYDFAPAVLNQQKCTYDPHIVLMQPGDLKVTTDDPVPHNIHSYSEANRTYNESMNSLNREMSLHFARPERISLKCDLHGWMQAYVVVAANPYYTLTKNAGAFQLRDVPAGTYQLKVWQETLGESTQTVTVQAGRTAKVNFRLNSPAPERAEVQ